MLVYFLLVFAYVLVVCIHHCLACLCLYENNTCALLFCVSSHFSSFFSKFSCCHGEFHEPVKSS